MPTSKAAGTSSLRGELIVIDDPGAPKTEAEKARALAWVKDCLAGMQERFSGPPVIIMARLHEADIPGVVLEGDLGFEHLTLPPEQG